MKARISLKGTDIYCVHEKGEPLRLLLSEALDKMRAWERTYRRVVNGGDPALLLHAGEEIFAWLNEKHWSRDWVGGVGERVLEIAVEDPRSEAAAALLDVPWEILARDRSFFAVDAVQPFVVLRSVGRSPSDQPSEPAHGDLSAMFMAASPRGQSTLAFEAEEDAIRQATDRLNLSMVVEESGCAEVLEERLCQDGPFEVQHLSCHGNIQEDRPVLFLESLEGDPVAIMPEKLNRVFGEDKASLVFLSACRSAETQAAEPYVRELVRAGVPNVIGWDGSVYDADAIHFAQTLYRELVNQRSVPYAVAAARQAMVRLHLGNPRQNKHWHLARVYAGPRGAGALCGRNKPRRPAQKVGYKAFLDRERRVPVANARQFVGRRRAIQDVLRAFRDGRHAGVLVYGMGNLGKSSLAARISDRLPKHHTVVVFARYDADMVRDQLIQAVPAEKRQTWRRKLASMPFADGLEALLTGPLEENPVLLIIDDLERILEKPKPEHDLVPVADALGSPHLWREALGAVLQVFDGLETRSHLLITSRFRFTLPDGRGGDAADTLLSLQLRPMAKHDQWKQWRTARQQVAAMVGDAEALQAQALAVAGGNPGLQEILCRPILADETDLAQQAIADVRRWKTSGQVPDSESGASDFFKRVSFEIYAAGLSEDQFRQLQAANLFSEGVAVPLAALKAAGVAFGVCEQATGLTRLLNLGLVDHWGDINGTAHGAANPMARPLGGVLCEDGKARLAKAVIPILAEAWQDEDGEFPENIQGVEAAKIALLGDAPVALLERAVYAGASASFHKEHDAATALQLFLPALERFLEQGHVLQPRLLRLASECAKRVGKVELQVALLEGYLSQPNEDKAELGAMIALHARATVFRDGPEKALARLKEAVALLEASAMERECAVIKGFIGDILMQRGETEEALRIRREEELPVYEKLGDVRERAVTQGKIADILMQRGETEEALRIRREEELPVFEKLGDVRERAVTMTKIADILQSRGEKNEALRIFTHDCFPTAWKIRDHQLINALLHRIAALDSKVFKEIVAQLGLKL